MTERESVLLINVIFLPFSFFFSLFFPFVLLFLFRIFFLHLLFLSVQGMLFKSPLKDLKILFPEFPLFGEPVQLLHRTRLSDDFAKKTPTFFATFSSNSVFSEILIFYYNLMCVVALYKFNLDEGRKHNTTFSSKTCILCIS